jgi:Fe-S oxidoreductase
MKTMETKEAIEQIDSCIECDVCLDVCQTYEVTQQDVFGPIHRLHTARNIFQGEEINSEEIESIYNCMKCGRCNVVCPMDIDIAGVIRKAQIDLVRREVGPLESPNRVMAGIQKLDNAFNGDPAKKWDWLPEEFPKRESDTLLYIGCSASFAYPQAARTSYLLLKKLGVDFMLLKDESCCGYFYYYVGREDLAREKFEQNVEKFKRQGIKRIITLCAGCYHSFKNWYPELLGRMDFEIVHISQLLPDLLKERSGDLRKDGREMTYHDPCGLGRLGGGIYGEPREALRLCGVNLVEAEQSRELSSCCGAMIINNFRDMAAKVAGNFLDKVNTSDIVTSCTFCLFGLNYGNKKTGKNKKIHYLSEVVLDSLNSSGAS